MSITHTITTNWQGSSGAALASSQRFTGNLELNMSEPVAPTSTNLALSYTLPTHANLQSFFCNTDNAVSLFFNAPSTGSPILTIALPAGGCYTWNAASGAANPFSADVTSLYATNASSSLTANPNIRSLRT